jgi:peptidylprolyl isomerase
MGEKWVLVLLTLLISIAVPVTGCAGRVKEGDTVQVHYTGTLGDGTMFDSSLERDPLQFTIGEGQVIAGFEEAVVGMEVGESVTVTIPVNKAYGPYREDMLLVVTWAQLPEGFEPEVGRQLQIRPEGGQPISVVVKEFSDSSVTLDANHPLAGKDLTFTIELVKIL